MLTEPGHSPYDLRFWLFGTPVRVHPFFWLFTVILGWDFLSIGFAEMAIWVACCFLSILLHEFGHVWMGRAFGARDSYIVLYSFGGLAVGSSDLWHRWQRVAVSLAGPGIELVLYGLIRLGLWSLSEEQLIRIPERAWFAISIVLYINLVWALLNLLPVWPLDGGQVSRELFEWRSPRNGQRLALRLSVAVGAFIAVHALLARSRGAWVIPYLPTSPYSAILFGVLAFQSWQLLQQLRPPRYEEVDDRMPWESDPDAWKRR